MRYAFRGVTMKAVLISTQPKWCERIATGVKMVEVRKSKPKLKLPSTKRKKIKGAKDNVYISRKHTR